MKSANREKISALVLPLAFIYLEMMARGFFFDTFLSIGIIYVLLSSCFVGFLLSWLFSFAQEKGQRVLTSLTLFIAGVYFAGHLVYQGIFKSFFSWSTLGLAGDVTAFWREGLQGAMENWYKIVLPLLPWMLFLIFRKHYGLQRKGNAVRYGAASLAMSSPIRLCVFSSAMISLLLFMIFTVESGNWKTLIYMQGDVPLAMKTFGLGSGSAVDIAEMIFGTPNEQLEIDLNHPDQTEVQIKELDTIKSTTLIDDIRDMIVDGNLDDGSLGKEPVSYNTLYIDWDKLIENAPNDTIREMHQYYASLPATNKNDYTGMFEGKNLIFLTLEAFSYKALSPQKTPMLWKMYTEGFNFTNFYAPLWGGSTASGEYCNMTGNYYTTAKALSLAADTYTYSSLGNLFRGVGYSTIAYHNYTDHYYSRNRSHPNFGYKYKAVGSGLKLQHYSWPNSDYEMAVATADEVLSLPEPFHAYYMTVSGHGFYHWDNDMDRKHQSEVMDLKYRHYSVKSYIAGQLEVEYMIEYLVDKLDKAGKLDNTVFVMSCDHYPYALLDGALAELYGVPEKGVLDNFEVFHNALIIWSSSMEEPIRVDKPCCSLDILPTVANLFGIEYESKVITGTDIFSDDDVICIINTNSTFWNWKTAQGTYNSTTGNFTPSETCTLSKAEISEYVNKVNARLKAMRKYSLDILKYDYYSYVFNRDGTPIYRR